MALTIKGERAPFVGTNTTPVTVGVTVSLDVPAPPTPVAGYHILWTVSGGTAVDLFSFSVGTLDGGGIDLGDHEGSSSTGLYVRGPIDSVACVPDFAGGSAKSVTFHVLEVTDLPDVQTVQRIEPIDNTTGTPLVITLPDGTEESSHEWSFSLVGTWGGGATTTPTETEPGGYTTSFGALVADYRCARRVGPVAGFQMVLAAIPAAGITFTSTHQVPV